MFEKFKSVFDASSPMEAVQAAIDEFSSQTMTLRLVCQYTGEPVGDGYEITAPRELVPKLLPLMSAGLKAMKAVNGVTRIGRLFGLPLPEVPKALQEKLATMIDGLGAGESGFACVAEAAGEAVKGDSAAAKTELSRFQLREFEAFLNEADPDGLWRCATSMPAFAIGFRTVFVADSMLLAAQRPPRPRGLGGRPGALGQRGRARSAARRGQARQPSTGC